MSKEKTDQAVETIVDEGKEGEVIAKLSKKQAKDQAIEGYEEYFAKVFELKNMTDEKTWRDFYSSMMDIRTFHKEAIITAEKTREIVQHQEAIKFVNRMFKNLIRPIDDLNSYCTKMPLFAADFHTRAKWLPENGTVEFYEAR